MNVTRRRAIQQLTCSALGIAAHPLCATTQKGTAWHRETFQHRTVFCQGTGRRLIILLHELNGLSPGCIDFGQDLVAAGFQVRMPLLFGHFHQDTSLLGSIESCVFGGFHCNALGSSLPSETAPIRWLRSYVAQLQTDPTIQSIGVIGMCLSGAYPIAVMDLPRVRAVVLSQPALPFGGSKQQDVGLPAETLMAAKRSGVPMLGFRFSVDTICTACRLQFIQDYFGSEQFRAVTFENCDCKQTITHRCHAVLTGPSQEARQQGRRLVIQLFREKLT